MTPDEAITLLHKHKPLFDWYVSSKCIPDLSDSRMKEIRAAYEALNPGFILNATCSACVKEMFENANRHRIHSPRFREI